MRYIGEDAQLDKVGIESLEVYLAEVASYNLTAKRSACGPHNLELMYPASPKHPCKEGLFSASHRKMGTEVLWLRSR